MLSPTHRFPWSLFPSANHHLRCGHGKVTFCPPKVPSDSSSTSRVVEPQYWYHTTADAAYLEVDLPGVKKEDLKIDVEGQKLTITGKRYKVHHKLAGEAPSPAGEPDIIYSVVADFGHDADVVHTTPESMSDGALTLRVPLRARGKKHSIRIAS